MATYVIESKREAEIYSFNGRNFQNWHVFGELDGEPTQAEISTVAGGTLPNVGEPFAVETKPGREDRVKLKRLYGQTGSASDPKEPRIVGASSIFRPMDPNREASIIRQHSQQMAIMWSAVLQRENKLPDTEDRGLKSLIDYFDLDVRNNAGKSE